MTARVNGGLRAGRFSAAAKAGPQKAQKAQKTTKAGAEKMKLWKVETGETKIPSEQDRGGKDETWESGKIGKVRSGSAL